MEGWMWIQIGQKTKIERMTFQTVVFRRLLRQMYYFRASVFGAHRI